MVARFAQLQTGDLFNNYTDDLLQIEVVGVPERKRDAGTTDEVKDLHMRALFAEVADDSDSDFVLDVDVDDADDECLLPEVILDVVVDDDGKGESRIDTDHHVAAMAQTSFGTHRSEAAQCHTVEDVCLQEGLLRGSELSLLLDCVHCGMMHLDDECGVHAVDLVQAINVLPPKMSKQSHV